MLYGNNTTDGVINIITKRNTPGFEFGIEGTGGNDNTRSLNAYATRTYHDLSYAVSGRPRKSSGY